MKKLKIAKLIFIVHILSLIFLLISANNVVDTANNSENIVLKLRIEGEITPATKTLVEQAFETAEGLNIRLIIVTLDTPGGQLIAVQDIMRIFEESKIPVAAFVYPSGSVAWSGGTYILMASDIAVMASGTTIGSCQPVLATGEYITEPKVINALVGLMTNYARLHSRNEEVAKLFITQNLNLGPEEALQYNVIELIADAPQQVLSSLENYVLIKYAKKEGTTSWKLISKGFEGDYNIKQKFEFDGISSANILEYQPGFGVYVYQIIVNPFLSSLLLMIGIFSLLIGIKSPGHGAEVGGAICILIALIGIGIIGISLAAMLLFALGIFLVLLELKTHVGALAISGVFCIILGSLFLFPSPQWLLAEQVLQQLRLTLVSVSVIFSCIFAFVVWKVRATLKREKATGIESMIGMRVRTKTRLNPKGKIKIGGEIWNARTEARWIDENEEVIIVGIERLTLLVKPTDDVGQLLNART